MPKIRTEYRWDVPTQGEIDKKELRAGKIAEVKKLKAGDEVLIILEGFYVRENKEWGSAEINISLQVATKSTTKDITIGTFRGIKDNAELISNPVVLLPATKIEDHLNIAVNAIELDRVEEAFGKIPQMTQYLEKLSEYVPIPGLPTVVKSAGEIVGAIVNLAGLINTDDTILHNNASFVIDEEKFPGLNDEFYLKEGTLRIVETQEVPESEKPTTISLKIMKKKGIGTV